MSHAMSMDMKSGDIHFTSGLPDDYDSLVIALMMTLIILGNKNGLANC